MMLENLLLKLMKENVYLTESSQEIVSVNSPALLSSLSRYYRKKIGSIERVDKKKVFLCKSWKVNFINSPPAFMKLNISSTRALAKGEDEATASSPTRALAKGENEIFLAARPLLCQLFINQLKIFKDGEGVLSLWPMINRRCILLIKSPQLTIAFALTDFLPKARKLSKKGNLSVLAGLLAALHLGGKKIIGDCQKQVFVHGDLTRENILVDANGRVRFTDWENLKIDWPEYDLACFVRDGRDAYGLNMDASEHRLFFKAYEEHSGLKINYERLRQYLKSFKKI